MRTLALSAIALCAATSVALAEPLELTDGQMDRVTAGNFQNLHLTIFAPITVNVFGNGEIGTQKVNVGFAMPIAIVDSDAVATRFGVLGPGGQSSAFSQALSQHLIRILQQ